MSDRAAQIAENVARVRQRIEAAAKRVGRDPAEIKLVAVTKYVTAAEVRAVVACGCTDLGESRPQTLWAKATELADLPIRWHMIGHLQRNKIRRTVALVSLVHSIDSVELLEAIEREAAALDCHVRGLLEVNISGEPAKHGLAFDEVERMLESLPGFSRVTIAGVMGMAGLEADAVETRRQFAALREARDRWRRAAPAGVELAELSIGMSGDFEIAIEEGATIVRIGSALWA